MENRKKFGLLVIGGSAGSLSVFMKIIPELKLSMDLAVVAVFHRKPSEDDMLVEVLASKTEYLVKEAEDKDEIKAGVIYVAPAEYHLLLEKDKTLSLDVSEKVNYSRPSIDVTFETAAEVYKDALACVLLSGANADGVHGLQEAAHAGAYIIVQDPATAEVPFMPQRAMESITVDLILHPESLEAFSRLFI